MRRLLASACLLACLGAGCVVQRADVDRTTGVKPPWTQGKDGIALVTQADDVGGQPISTTDASGKWTFSTALASTLTDGRGTYPGSMAGESISVQLGVGGTVEQDRQLMEDIKDLGQFKTGDLTGWSLTSSYDTKAQRWIVRAAKKDVTTAGAYHVIECDSATHSTKIFWDDCHTFILHADVELTKAQPWTAAESP